MLLGNALLQKLHLLLLSLHDLSLLLGLGVSMVRVYVLGVLERVVSEARVRPGATDRRLFQLSRLHLWLLHLLLEECGVYGGTHRFVRLLIAVLWSEIAAFEVVQGSACLVFVEPQRLHTWALVANVLVVWGGLRGLLRIDAVFELHQVVRELTLLLRVVELAKLVLGELDKLLFLLWQVHVLLALTGIALLWLLHNELLCVK